MATLASSPFDGSGRSKPWLELAPIALGLAVLYAPVFYRLALGLWQEDEHFHEAIALCMALWCLWDSRASLIPSRPSIAETVCGSVCLIVGLLLYVLGVSQSVDALSVGALIPILGALALLYGGFSLLKAAAVPIFFLLFVIPLPGILVQSITVPLKFVVSAMAENIMYWLGYPVARNGVVLSVGQYQLLVADACSGLNSIFSPGAMGLFYIYLSRYRSKLRTILLLLSVVPIAFAANVIRVVVLILITYHLGDEAGQGFLHSSAGILLFIIALIMLFLFDAFLGLLFDRRALGKSRESTI